MSIQPIPSMYQTDNLLLIIGSNPLPNYVAARLLLKNGGNLFMINTQGSVGTKEVAERLKAHLRKEYVINTADRIPVSDSDAFNIYTCVARKLATIPENESIGLHYTGGTKAMAIHAYRAVQDSPHATVFSYLDAREMALVIESVDGERTQEFSLKRWPLQGDNSRPPTIRDLTDLHQESLRDGLPSQDVILPDVAQKLAHACNSRDMAEEWRIWCNRRLRGNNVYDRNDDRWRSEQTLHNVNLEWPQSSNLKRALAEGFDQLGKPSFNLGSAAANVGFEGCEALCLWLDGLWLEYYVLHCIESLKDKALIHDYGMGLRTNRGRGIKYSKLDLKAKHDFEMDVAVMQSYQLFAISCTTSTSKAKTKLFEAMIRSQQLGGDESRTGLVAPVTPAYAKKLEDEVAEKWQMGGKVKVFSPTTWSKLATAFERWFERGE